MSKFILDRMLWCPKREVNLGEIVNRLTIKAETYTGEGEYFFLFEETEFAIGVPRAWGLSQKWLTDGHTIEDYTVCPRIDWPSIKCKYWKGQEEAVKAIINKFRYEHGARLDAPCGSGKCLMGLDIASKLGVKTLVLVHKDDLAKQWHNTAKLFFSGVNLGHVQGDTWDYKNKHVVTAMAQTLYARRDKISPEFWKQFGLVIVDESHRFSAKTFEHSMRMPRAKYRLGVSATWRRSDGLGCIWNWHISDTAYKMKTDRLTGKYVQIPCETDLHDSQFKVKGRISNARWLNGIAAYPGYSEWLAEQIVEGAKVGRKVLCLSDRIAHLEKVKAHVEKISNFEVGMYVGSLNKKRVTQDELEKAARCPVIMATYKKVGEGTDIPAIDTLVLATPRSDIEQAVGRIQRPANKKELLVVDPVFNSRYMKNLAVKREVLYRKLKFKRGKE